MTPTAIERAHIDRFRALVVQHFGLAFDDGKLDFMREVLARRMADTRADVSTYLHRLGAPDSQELRALAREITVGETYFFRYFNQFRALAEAVVPARLAARAESRTLNILSAGCASGEEPYSLVMLLRDLDLDPRWSVTVRGVDVNPVAIAKAKHATYSPWSLREVPDELRQRWFSTQRGQVEVRDDVRQAVRFDERNLSHEDTELWAPGRWDVIFCRNVLMYFEPAVARAIIARMTQSLAPDGYLFLGHAETLRGLSEDYELMNTHETFYYRRRSAPGDPARAAARPWPPSPVAVAPVAVLDEPYNDGWIETIRLTAERIQRLSEPRSETAEGAGLDVAGALALFTQERYDEALAIFEGVDDLPLEPTAALLLAILQMHTGLLTAAERTARRLVARGLQEADAEHIVSLCSEKAGAREDAVTHDLRAAALDPSFAMPRLHLGLMAYVEGDYPTVQTELGQASVLLEDEDATRLVLFGGGFGREALIGMCRLTMQRSGSRA